MRWLDRLLRSAPQLDIQQLNALDQWRAAPAAKLDQPLTEARLVVVDVESSGLNPHYDSLISIGALAVNRRGVEFAQSFEVILQQDAPSSTANILVHGIGGTQQCDGVDPGEGLLSFLQFAGKDPLVAFFADFDRIMIGRALDSVLAVDLDQPWLDMAWLAPALLGERAPRAKNLDDWLGAFDIHNYARHNAVADTLATAQLLLIVLEACARRGVRTVADLITTARGQRWLERR